MANVDLSAAYRSYSDAEITAQIALWKAALTAISVNQSYSIAGRSVTRANLEEVQSALASFQIEKERRDGTAPDRCTYADHSGISNLYLTRGGGL